jgi:hypothetical protein
MMGSSVVSRLRSSLSFALRFAWLSMRRAVNRNQFWAVALFMPAGLFAQIPPSSAPTLLSPENGAVDIPQTLYPSWSSVGGAAITYQLQVSTDTNFYEPLDVNEDNIKSLSCYSCYKLSHGVLYYWRVRGKSGSSLGPWSTVFNFRYFPDIPETFEGNPYGPDAALSPHLAWKISSTEPVLQVQLQVAVGPQVSPFLPPYSSAPGPDFTNLILDDSTLAENSRDMGPLNGATYYFWRVRAKNRAGWGAWMTMSFNTLPPPPGDTNPIAPLDSAGDFLPGAPLKWRRVAWTKFYHLQVSQDSIFSSLVFDNSLLPDTFAVPNLSRDTRYFWRVRANNASGEGPWFAARSFITAPPPPGNPRMIYPIHGRMGVLLNPTLSWRSVSGAVRYIWRVYEAQSVEGKYPVVDSGTIVDTSVTVSQSLQLCHDYYWDVVAQNAGGSSVWMREIFRTIAIPNAPVLVAPSAGATDISVPVKLIWRPTGNETGYRVQLATDSSFEFTPIDSLLVPGAGQTPDTAFTLYNLPQGARFYWRIGAVNTCGPSPVSIHSEFTTMGEVPEPIVGLHHSAGFQILSREGVIRYELQGTSRVQIQIHNLRGKLVATPVNVVQGAGFYAVPLSLGPLSPGRYLLTFKAGGLRRKQGFNWGR